MIWLKLAHRIEVGVNKTYMEVTAMVNTADNSSSCFLKMSLGFFNKDKIVFLYEHTRSIAKQEI